MATERGCIGEYIPSMEPMYRRHVLLTYILLLATAGFTGTNARPSIAPTFGVQPCMGTNPLTFGVPTSDPFPFVIDCATSINQRLI